MPKKPLYYLVTIVGFIIFFIAAYLLSVHDPVVAPTTHEATQESTPATVPPSFKGNEDTFKNALNLFIQKKQEGVDMTSGPCLGSVGDDWVLDIAHNPRVPEDDKPQNQCADFKSGKVHHFIEFDPDGKLIRLQ